MTDVRLSCVDPSVVEAIAAGVLSALRDSYHADAQAEGAVRAVGTALRDAGNALERAAEDLKRSGRGVQASQAFMASRVAFEVAQEVLG